MSKPSYLVRRDGLYFAVINIPRRLQLRLNRKQIWRSLKTGTYNIAIENLKVEVGSIMSFLEMMADSNGKEALTAKYYKAIIEKIITKLLNDDQEGRISKAGSKSLLDKQKSKDKANLKKYQNALSKANYNAVEGSVVSYLRTSGLLWE